MSPCLPFHLWWGYQLAVDVYITFFALTFSFCDLVLNLFPRLRRHSVLMLLEVPLIELLLVVEFAMLNISVALPGRLCHIPSIEPQAS